MVFLRPKRSWNTANFSYDRKKITQNEERHTKEMTNEYFSGGLLLKEVFRNMGTGEIASNAVKSVGKNLRYNMLAEGAVALPYVAGKIKDRWQIAAGYADDVIEGGSGTRIVWDDIKLTQSMREGTQIPKSVNANRI